MIRVVLQSCECFYNNHGFMIWVSLEPRFVSMIVCSCFPLSWLIKCVVQLQCVLNRSLYLRPIGVDVMFLTFSFECMVLYVLTFFLFTLFCFGNKCRQDVWQGVCETK